MAAAQFRQIAEAYETLSDPDRRRRYDTAGGVDAGAERQHVRVRRVRFLRQRQRVGRRRRSAICSPTCCTQREARRAEGARRARRRSASVHHGELRGRDARRAARVTVTRQEPCRVCARRPAGSTSPRARCVQCQGTGVVRSVRGHMVFSKPCAHCGGTGRQRQTRVPDMRRAADRDAHRAADHQRPAGLGRRRAHPGAGQRARGSPAASPATCSSPSTSQPHPLFRREGDDLHIVGAGRGARGGARRQVEVPTLDGRARLRVPPGTQSGQRFRLRERGVPSPRDGRRGDLVVEVRLVLPQRARRAIERAAARVRADQRRGCPAEELRRAAPRRAVEP